MATHQKQTTKKKKKSKFQPRLLKGRGQAHIKSTYNNTIINITDMKVTMYTAIDSINKDYTIDDCPIIHIQKIGIQNKLIVYEVFIRCDK